MIMYNNNVQYPVVVDDSVQWRKCFHYLLKRGRLFFIIVPYFQINLTGDEFLQGIGLSTFGPAWHRIQGKAVWLYCVVILLL